MASPDFRVSDLPWLVAAPENFRARCQQADASATTSEKDIRQLANFALDVNQLVRLAKTIKTYRERGGKGDGTLSEMRLAFLSDTTTDYIVPALIASAARHGVLLHVVNAAFGQIAQTVFAPDSVLRTEEVDAVLIAQDVRKLGLDQSDTRVETGRSRLASACADIEAIVKVINDELGIPAILQTVPQTPEAWCGSFDRVAGASSRKLVENYNAKLVELASANGNLLFDADHVAALVGYDTWYRPSQWTHAKLPFALDLVPLYADHIGRLLGALRGKARKCLVLDLDNTLWGGVIGDDGIEGIRLGQGSAEGEAHLLLQAYALQCKNRGVVLAVCSKNEMEAALLPFRKHPDMLLKEEDIAVFIANWEDKASNLAEIAKTLNIGTDSLVFVDDNPAERARVRQMLPEVAVPELIPDPSFYARALGVAGYFEAVAISEEDRLRADFYRANAERSKDIQRLGDMDGYLRSLEMVCTIKPFDAIGRARIAQLINKSNQFNLTTRRYTEKQVQEIESDPSRYALQVRLVDKFGDNGMISVVIFETAPDAWICDTWLMSCRVLGRKVEEAVLANVANAARKSGAKRLVGKYLPSAKNAMVSEHFGKLGFSLVNRSEDGTSTWSLDLAGYSAPELPLDIRDSSQLTESAA